MKTFKLTYIQDSNTRTQTHEVNSIMTAIEHSGIPHESIVSVVEVVVESKPVKKTVINKKYTHFCVSNATGKIVDAWEYPADYDKIDIKDFYVMDMKDNDRELKDYKLLEGVKLFKKGINPYDSANWGNN